MKLIRVIVYSLVMAFSLVGVAEAKGSNGGSAFRGGFSSQRQKAPSAAPASSRTTRTGFGGFGSTKNSADQKSANTRQSQLGTDLGNNAAQANALKTMDARNNANNATTANNGNGNGGNGWFRQGNNTNATPNYSAAPVIHQTVVRHDSGGFMHGLMWFMLGHSMAQHNNTVYVPVNNQASGQWDPQVQNPADINSADITPVAVAQPQESESIFTKLLRLVLWIAFITSVIWGVRKFMRIRNRISKTHYSLGK